MAPPAPPDTPAPGALPSLPPRSVRGLVPPALPSSARTGELRPRRPSSTPRRRAPRTPTGYARASELHVRRSCLRPCRLRSTPRHSKLLPTGALPRAHRRSSSLSMPLHAPPERRLHIHHTGSSSASASAGYAPCPRAQGQEGEGLSPAKEGARPVGEQAAGGGGEQRGGEEEVEG